MASFNPVHIAAFLNQPVIAILSGNADGSQIVNTQLNAVLKAQLTSSATVARQTTLASLLQNLAPGDLAADQSLSLRDFVTKYTTLPTDPSANQTALAAIATLSATTTVGALLSLNGTIATFLRKRTPEVYENNAPRSDFRTR